MMLMTILHYQVKHIFFGNNTIKQKEVLSQTEETPALRKYLKPPNESKGKNKIK